LLTGSVYFIEGGFAVSFSALLHGLFIPQKTRLVPESGDTIQRVKLLCTMIEGYALHNGNVASKRKLAFFEWVMPLPVLTEALELCPTGDAYGRAGWKLGDVGTASPTHLAT